MIELEARTVKSTKTTVVLYKTTGFADGNYATACYGQANEPHSGIVYHDTRRSAREWIPDPQTWCCDCQEKKEKSNSNETHEVQTT